MRIYCLFLIVLFVLNASAQTRPYLCFTDLTSGPATGNSDDSQSGQKANLDGAIVTVWGKHLGNTQGNSKILISGKEARVYQWSNALTPADLFTRLGMQKIEFQIPGSTPKGMTDIKVVVQRDTSNALPFMIRDGKIYFVMKQGNDASGDGSWSKPWASLDNVKDNGALIKIQAGDIVYVGNGVVDTVLAGDRSCVDIGDPGTVAAPKAIVGYPGAKAGVGNINSKRTFSLWVSGFGPSIHWVISKLHLTAMEEAVSMYHDFRVVGNKIMAPKGDGPTGAIAGSGNHLYILGNELTNIGYRGTSKLYHPIYIQSAESCSGPRLPLEIDREIAWNDMHDNLAFDGINLYRECGSSAYMTNHRVHDNLILNQTGCGIRIGDYVVGENWFYNNLVVNAGLGPDPTTEQAMHVPVLIHAGWDDTTTLIHFYNNTIYGGGFTGGADWASSMVGFGYNHPFNLDFRNNIIVSTNPSIDYLNFRLDTPRQGVVNNLWYGESNPPGWDKKPYGDDPLFVNSALFDFHLAGKSPAIDAGIPLLSTQPNPVPVYDFDGHLRDKGKAHDIGALEFQNTSVVGFRNSTIDRYHVFPNPAKDYITLQWKDKGGPLSIGLFDLQGRKLISTIYRGRALIKNQEQINISRLTSGAYLLKINDQGHKIIIQQ